MTFGASGISLCADIRGTSLPKGLLSAVICSKSWDVDFT